MVPSLLAFDLARLGEAVEARTRCGLWFEIEVEGERLRSLAEADVDTIVLGAGFRSGPRFEWLDALGFEREWNGSGVLTGSDES